MNSALAARVVVGAVVAAVMLASFAVVMSLGVPILSEERPVRGAGDAGAATAGVGLLVIDAVAPVPSSGVMVGLGAVFGAIVGAALAMVGSIAGAAVGWGIGRRGGPWLDGRVASSGRLAAGRTDRAGLVAVITSRPIPVVAETVMIVAGASGMPLRRALPAAAVGSLPPALAYAAAGAAATEADVALPVVLVVMALAGLAWIVGGRRPVTTS